MRNLPKFRVTGSQKAFTHSGLDMCGAFPITIGKIRGAKVHKAYICLFICCSMKALHLELISDFYRRLFSRPPAIYFQTWSCALLLFGLWD